jgi:FlaA1/EpsC-like NDP-sugar epimerase
MTPNRDEFLPKDERLLDGYPGWLLEGLRGNRRLVAYHAYALITIFALLVAYGARFDLAVPADYRAVLPLHLGALTALRLLAARAMRLTDSRWRYVGVDDILRLVAVAGTSSFVFTVLFRGLPQLPNVPYSVVLMEWFIFTLGVAGVWLAYRRMVEVLTGRRARNGGSPPRRLVIVGCGETGSLLSREINRLPGTYRLVGFLDDDPTKKGTRVHGVPVLGTVAQAPEVLAAAEAEELAIAIPSASPSTLRRILADLEPLKLPVKVLPGIRQVMEGEVGVGHLRPVRIEDLLGREPVELRIPKLEADLQGRTVLVTGAAGSIGSELARQIAFNSPARLVLLDQAESDLYFVDVDLRVRHPELEVVPIVGDILDGGALEKVFRDYRPDRVYHAAAYKHVPLMQKNLRTAVRNNVLGSWDVARLAGRYGAGRFILISTDKAADPACVMGATKRASERVVRTLQADYPDTHYTAVRFGNVLGSAGSVIPLFQRQIAEGGPITITHPDVTRYFMTIAEAVQLVLQAGLLEEVRGEVAMLEMGEPVRILELARTLVRLQGLRPEVDIPFTYIGLRPGEKLHETLHGDAEDLDLTSLPAVYRLTTNGGSLGGPELTAMMQDLARDALVGKGWQAGGEGAGAVSTAQADLA